LRFDAFFFVLLGHLLLFSGFYKPELSHPGFILTFLLVSGGLGKLRY
jgi:hypothetical protein